MKGKNQPASVKSCRPFIIESRSETGVRVVFPHGRLFIVRESMRVEAGRRKVIREVLVPEVIDEEHLDVGENVLHHAANVITVALRVKDVAADGRFQILHVLRELPDVFRRDDRRR